MEEAILYKITVFVREGTFSLLSQSFNESVTFVTWLGNPA